MNHLDDRAKHYLTDDMFVVFGDDFRYMNAFQNYENLDNMIEYMNEHHSDKYFFRYSTPSEYVDALNKHNVTWPTKYDDMFPYADHPDAYWTGYFSSRANDKEYIRRASQHFHTSTYFYSQKVLDETVSDAQVQGIQEAVGEMMDDLGINQHHDAATGTGKQHVAGDYAHRLFEGMEISNKVYSQLIAEQARMMDTTTPDGLRSAWSQCLRTNSSYLDCPIANYTMDQNYTMYVMVHKPSAISSNSTSVLVPHGHYRV